MHWGSGLFLFFCFLLFLPLQLQFQMTHQTCWNGTITFKFLFIHYTKYLRPEELLAAGTRKAETVQKKIKLAAETIASEPVTPFSADEKPEQDDEKGQKTKKSNQFWKWRHGQEVERSFQAHWKSVAQFTLWALKIVVHKVQFEQLSLRCFIGFSQPSWTAYSYGFFWTVLSVLPLDHIKKVDLEYIPDFQQQRQEIYLQGIISCRFGQLIHILFSLLWLVLKMTLEQNRKEQMVYES